MMAAFTQTSGTSSQLAVLYHSNATVATCKRRSRPHVPHYEYQESKTRILCARASDSRPSQRRNSKQNAKRNNDDTEILQNNPFPEEEARVPRPSELPDSKFAEDGYGGFRKEDDEFWTHYRAQVMAYRAGTILTPDMLKPPDRPLDRHGKPPAYPAAAHYDPRSKTWVATTEEEEERMREPSPVRDPYFIREAGPGERNTTLRVPLPVRSQDESDLDDYNHELFDSKQPTWEVLAGHRRRPLNMAPADWRVIHLGTSSAVPTRKRNVSSTAVLVDTRATATYNSSANIPTIHPNDVEPVMFLVDAGESTQMRLLQSDWCMTHGFRWIRAIFITHLHGDHIYGLPKLLWDIGRYTQYRRRVALEAGDDGSDPVIRIFGPYGTRGFLRTSLHWTRPLGVRFSVSELVPRDTDFTHLSGQSASLFEPRIFVHDMKSGEITRGSGVDLKHSCPPPLDEEIRTEDIHIGNDDFWHVWEEPCVDGRIVEVLAAPLRHRVPCFGYVFREKQISKGDSSVVSTSVDDNTGLVRFDIDKEKAKALGVYGSQFRVLRDGRPVKISKTGRVVTPEEVCIISEESKRAPEVQSTSVGMVPRIVTVLGDTCDSSAIAEAARGSDLLIHEATFAQAQAQNARIGFHSTARMAGEFGRLIKARKIALTHFSSRYEVMLVEDTGTEKRPEKRGGFVFLENEAEDLNTFHENGDHEGFDDDIFGDIEDRLQSTESEPDLSATVTNPEDVYGLFTPPYSSGNVGERPDVDVLNSFEHTIYGDEPDNKEDGADHSVSDTEDEDLVSANILVREAYEGFGSTEVEIVAARDFMEHNIPAKFSTQISNSTNTNPSIKKGNVSEVA